MLKGFLGVACALLILSVSTVSLGYGAWEGHEEADPAAASLQELDALIERLEETVERAIQASAAHPGFLADLEDILDSFKETRDAIREEGLPRTGPAAWGEYQDEDITEGLAIWFPFNREDEFGIIPSGCGTTELVLESDAIRWVADANFPGGGLLFPAEDHGGAYFEADLGDLHELTVEMWVFIKDWGSHTHGYGRLFTNETDSGSVRMWLHEGGFARYNQQALVVHAGDYRVTTEAESIGLDQWHHIALVHDGTELAVYIDGTRQTLRRYEGADGPLAMEGAPVTLLGNNPDGEYHFHGVIGELKIWSAARSVADIRREVATKELR